MERNYTSADTGISKGGGGVLYEVSYGKALLWGPTPYRNHVLYTIFDRTVTPFVFLP